MDIIKRDEYVDWLRAYKDKKLIKVITGLRRVGKSTIFDLYLTKPHTVDRMNARERIRMVMCFFDGKILRNTALSLGSFEVFFGSSGKSHFLIT